MNSEVQLVPGYSPRTGKIGRVQIELSNTLPLFAAASPQLRLISGWNQLRDSDVFWRKRGWYLYRGQDGCLYYQCTPTAEDRLKMLLEALLHDELVDQLKCSAHNRRLQLLLLDEMMYCDEDEEESMMSALWDAVESAMICGLLAGYSNMLLSP